jgi:hypothetical protein
MKLTGDLKSKVDNAKNKEEAKGIIEEAGMLLTDEEVEKVAGGGGGGGFYMTVGNCNGSYLALRPQPVWDQYHELYQLYPGYTVFTYGETRNGTGLNGKECIYRFVSYDGIWGYANAAFLY